jgi:hypothetical protein
MSREGRSASKEVTIVPGKSSEDVVQWTGEYIIDLEDKERIRRITSGLEIRKLRWEKIIISARVMGKC